MKTTKKCLYCNEEIVQRRSDAKFCSNSCKANAWEKSRNESFSTEKKNRIRIHPSSLDLLTNATWDFAHSILWNGFPFSNVEEELAKLYIKEYYEQIPPEQFAGTAHKHFTAYCERILLAKKYVSRFPHRYIPHPCIWLDKDNPKGFAGTKRWYIENLAKRRDIHYCENCKENFSLNPVLNHFHFTA